MSDDDTDLMYRAFRIEETGEEFDLDIPPTSGQEYLRRVQIEAKKCPAIVVADIDTTCYKSKQTFKVSGSSGIHPAPHGYAPSAQWQREQNAKFSHVRQCFARYKADQRKQSSKKKDQLPDKTEVEAWCQLCFGRLCVSERSGLPGPPPSNVPGFIDDTDESEADTASGTNDQRMNGERGNPPLLSIVGCMDQPTVIQVLEYHINWFEATGFTEKQGQWFYALLTSLEKPLDPEACSLLRSLARDCANLRASLESVNDPKLAPLNLLICLVSQYFGQSDLADDR